MTLTLLPSEYLGGSNVKGPEPNATFGPAPFYQFVGESAIVGAKYSAAGAQTVADFATAGVAGGGYNPVENTAKRFSALSLTTANDYGTLAMGGSLKNPMDVYNDYNAPKEARARLVERRARACVPRPLATMTQLCAGAAEVLPWASLARANPTSRTGARHRRGRAGRPFARGRHSRQGERSQRDEERSG